jgi:hypothetical protein
MKYSILAIICAILILWAVSVGIERQMKHECLVWEEYERTYPNFYWTEAQREQCSKY